MLNTVKSNELFALDKKSGIQMSNYSAFYLLMSNTEEIMSK